MMRHVANGLLVMLAGVQLGCAASWQFRERPPVLPLPPSSLEAVPSPPPGDIVLAEDEAPRLQEVGRRAIDWKSATVAMLPIRAGGSLPQVLGEMWLSNALTKGGRAVLDPVALENVEAKRERRQVTGSVTETVNWGAAAERLALTGGLLPVTHWVQVMLEPIETSSRTVAVTRHFAPDQVQGYRSAIEALRSAQVGYLGTLQATAQSYDARYNSALAAYTNEGGLWDDSTSGQEASRAKAEYEAWNQRWRSYAIQARKGADLPEPTEAALARSAQGPRGDKADVTVTLVRGKVRLLDGRTGVVLWQGFAESQAADANVAVERWFAAALLPLLGDAPGIATVAQ